MKVREVDENSALRCVVSRTQPGRVFTVFSYAVPIIITKISYSRVGSISRGSAVRLWVCIVAVGRKEGLE